METKQTYPIIHSDETKLFTIIERDENNVVIAVGNKLATSQVFKTVQAAKNYIAKKPWELLVNVMCIVNEKMKSYEESTQK